MPTYQYACKECGHRFDAVQSFAEDSLSVCPQCEGRLRKVFSAVGVVFKGSGFYHTDSRNEDHARRNGHDKPASGSADGKDGQAASSGGSDSQGSSQSQQASGSGDGSSNGGGSGESGSNGAGSQSKQKAESTTS